MVQFLALGPGSIYIGMHLTKIVKVVKVLQIVDPLPAVPYEGHLHDLLHLHDDISGHGEVHCYNNALIEVRGCSEMTSSIFEGSQRRTILWKM